MTTPRMVVSIELDEGGRKALRVASKLGERLRLFRRWMMYEFARDVHRGVLERIPGGRDTDRYAQAIRVKRLVAGPDADVFAAAVDPKAQRVRRIDPALTLVFVRPKGPRVDPVAEVLRRFGPWTLGTVPVLPAKRAAAVVFREVPAATVAEVARRRERERPAWRRALERHGVREFTGAFESPKRPGEAVPSVIFTGARLEFGGGSPAVPHWVPAVMDARRAALRRPLQKARLVLKLLSDSRVNARGLIPAVPRVSLRDLRALEAFQHRLNLKGASR